MNDGSKIGNKLDVSKIWECDIGAEMGMPPIKQRKKPLLIRIKVYKGTQLIRNHQKDFRSHVTREWINNLLLWAMNNKFRVEFHAE